MADKTKRRIRARMQRTGESYQAALNATRGSDAKFPSGAPPATTVWRASLVPLREWICDTCGEVIRRAEEGYVEWIRDDHGVSEFRICHHYLSSPSRDIDREGCYKHGNRSGRADVSIASMIEHGPVRMLSFIDVGRVFDPEASGANGVKDLHSWADTFRRLFVPHYEEARLLFERASADSFYDGANEISPFTKENLLRVIEDYGDR